MRLLDNNTLASKIPHGRDVNNNGKEIAGVRQRFEAYAAGAASGQELRSAVNDAVGAEPQLASAYVALTTAYFLTPAADQQLREAILEDIERITDAHRDSGMRVPLGDRPGGADPGAAANSDFSFAPSGHSTGTGSAWDSPDAIGEPAAALAVGSVLKNRYELQAELGRGGMGVVYKALDRANAEFKDRSPHVAIKVLNDEFKRHPLAIQSLARESKKALKLAHPNVVTVYNFSRDGGNVFMVMELLDGLSLDQVLKADGARGLPRARVIEILGSLGEALSYAHAQGIVHADFKPSNAFMTNDNVVKVLDFGIARAAQVPGAASEKTTFDVSQLHAISPSYASLEMLNDEPPDARDDVYALACVTYEMFTGRHPFNRIEATKARDANLQPAPIRGMPRSQWLALRRALAFERADRTPSVAEFVSAFGGASRSRKWAVGLIAVALVAAAAAVVVPRQLESYRAGQEAAAIAVAQGSAMSSALDRLKAAPASFRDRVLLDDRARAAIFAFYQGQIDGFIRPPQFDFAKARAKLGELRQLMPDSNAVATMAADLDKRANAQIARLLELRDRAVQRSVLIPEQGPESLLEVLLLIQQIDPAQKALTDPKVPGMFYFAAKAALDGNHLDMAYALVTAGARLSPNDKSVLALKDQVDGERQRLANLRRQSELEQRLAELNPAAPNFLEKIIANREDVTALQSIAPASPMSKRIVSSMEAVVALRVKQYLAEDNVAGAQGLMLNIGDLLPDASAAAQRDLIMQAANANQSKAFDTLERLRRAMLAGRMEKTGATGALDLYAQLQKNGASSDLLTDARDYLAYGYLKLARRARFENKLQLAESTLATGRNYKPTTPIQSMLSEEQQQLDAAAKPAGATPAPPPDLDSARGQFAQSLRASTLGEAELSAIARALDRLDSLGAMPQEVSSGLSQVEDRILQEAQRSKQQPGADPAQLVQLAAAMLPASDRLAEANKELRDSIAAADLRFRLQALLSQPKASEQWAADVKAQVQKLHAVLPATDASFTDARQIPAKTFLQAAAEAHNGKQSGDEKRFLALAREFDPAARQAPEAPATAARSEPTEPTDQGRIQAIEALKHRLESQADAGDVASAEKTANSLRSVLAGSMYVARDLPDTMVQAYVRRAKDQHAAGKIHDALQTLAAGERAYGGASDIKSLQAKYSQEAGTESGANAAH